MPIPTEITLHLYPEIPLRRESSDVCTNIRTVLATKIDARYTAIIPAIEPRGELSLTVPATYRDTGGEIRYTANCTYAVLSGMGENGQGLTDWFYFVEYDPDDLSNTGDTTVLRLNLDAWSTLTCPFTETVPPLPRRELLHFSSATSSLGHDAGGVSLAGGTDASRAWTEPPTAIRGNSGVVLIAAYSIKVPSTNILKPALVQVHGENEADAAILSFPALSAMIYQATVTIPSNTTDIGKATLLDLWVVPWSARPNYTYLRTLTLNNDQVVGSTIGYNLANFSYHSKYGVGIEAGLNRAVPVRYGNGDVSVEIPAHSSRRWFLSLRVDYNSGNGSVRAFIVGAGDDVEVTDSLSVPFSTIADPNQREAARIQDALTGISTAAGLVSGIVTLNPFAIASGIQAGASLAADVATRVYVNRREIAGGGIANTVATDGFASPSATFKDVIRAERLHPDNASEIENSWRLYGFSGVRRMIDYTMFAVPRYAFYSFDNISFPERYGAPWLLELLRDRLREGVRVWNTEENADGLLDWTQDPYASGLIP